MLVIATFGGGSPTKEISKVAKKIGVELAANIEWIVLSGGADPGADQSVKNRVLVGPAARPAKGWIGVLRGTKVEARASGSGLVLETTLGHKRNYLEACLCDAAIVLPGGVGTLSEAVSTLCLHKPAVFVGNEWTKSLPKLMDAVANKQLDRGVRDAWIDRALRGLWRGPRSYIDQLIVRDLVPGNLVNLESHIAYLPTASWSQILMTLRRLLAQSTAVHGFPSLANDPHQKLQTEYDAFVL
jgi:predicted Rossmann-fold nucleotide-binding protein